VQSLTLPDLFDSVESSTDPSVHVKTGGISAQAISLWVLVQVQRM